MIRRLNINTTISTVKKLYLGSKLKSFEQIIEDENTVAWFDSSDLETIVKNESNQVQYWYNKLNSAQRLSQNTIESRPLWSESGVLFDGVNDRMLFATTLIQPEHIYIVFTVKTFTYLTVPFDGYNNVSGRLSMESGGVTDGLGNFKLTAGFSNNSSVFVAPVEEKIIMRININGENSRLVVNENLPVIGNFGDRNMGGLCLGSQGNNIGHANIEVNEVILRKVTDSPADEKVIYDYLKKKNNLMDTEYETLSKAVWLEEPKNETIGNVSFAKITSQPIGVETINDYVAKDIEDAYSIVGSTRDVDVTLSNPQLTRFNEDGINCQVFDISDNYIYYGHESAFYRIDKHTFGDKVKFVFSGELHEGDGDYATAILWGVREMPDKGLLVNLRVGTVQRFFKLPFYNITTGTQIISSGNLVFTVNKTIAYMNRGRELSVRGNTVLAVVHTNPGRVYLSNDAGDSFHCILSTADSSININVPPEDEVFVSTKPDGLGGFGATGGHPMKDTLTNPKDFDLWGPTSNGNLHTHGGAIDPVLDRIYIVTGDGPPADGIFYSDDWGYNWTMIETDRQMPSAYYHVQFTTVIPMQDVVLLGSDCIGDGFWRLFRKGNELLDKIESCFQWTGYNSEILLIATGNCFTPKGTLLGIFGVDETDEHLTTKGGIAATRNGHNFKKVYEDSFSQNTVETAEVPRRGMISVNDNNKVIINAKNGGIITFDLTE